jgi:hypothetical protein
VRTRASMAATPRASRAAASPRSPRPARPCHAPLPPAPLAARRLSLRAWSPQPAPDTPASLRRCTAMRACSRETKLARLAASRPCFAPAEAVAVAISESPARPMRRGRQDGRTALTPARARLQCIDCKAIYICVCIVFRVFIPPFRGARLPPPPPHAFLSAAACGLAEQSGVNVRGAPSPPDSGSCPPGRAQASAWSADKRAC